MKSGMADIAQGSAISVSALVRKVGASVASGFPSNVRSKSNSRSASCKATVSRHLLSRKENDAISVRSLAFLIAL